MYVAPRVTPEQIRRFGYEMLTSSEDVIVVGHKHLAQGPGLILYLDIIHEFLHLVQRADGRELWDPKVDYVDRPTEIERIAIRWTRPAAWESPMSSSGTTSKWSGSRYRASTGCSATYRSPPVRARGRSARRAPAPISPGRAPSDPDPDSGPTRP